MKKKIFSAILVALLIASVLPLQALAEEPCSLKVFCKWNDNGIANAKVNIYRLADYNEDGQIVLKGAFGEYRAHMSSLNAEALRISAYTAYAFATVHAITPTASAVTDETGLAAFDALEKGVYLVAIENCSNEKEEGTFFRFAPFIVFLPDLQSGQSEVEAHPKAILLKSYAGTFTDIEVVKSWQDDNHTDLRPKNITVCLFCDGICVRTCKLNEKNNWRCTWKNMDASKHWMVIENNISPYYTVSVDEKEDFRFSLTNVLEDIPEETPEETLPRTGLVWWPVPVLAVIGIVLVVLGFTVRKKHEEIG